MNIESDDDALIPLFSNFATSRWNCVLKLRNVFLAVSPGTEDATHEFLVHLQCLIVGKYLLLIPSPRCDAIDCHIRYFPEDQILTCTKAISYSTGRDNRVLIQ